MDSSHQVREGEPLGRAAGDQTVVVIASTMRAGSTLLKALLAEAGDVSNLPEVNFQRFSSDASASAKIRALDAHPIVVLKRPAWYHELRTYPRVPTVPNLKCICLVRDAYETVVSLRKMSFRRFAPFSGACANRFLVQQYWSRINRHLLDLAARLGERARIVRYEDLVCSPKTMTHGLFRFIGSSCDHGVENYRQPEGFSWKWGSDDGGAQIRTLSVQSPCSRPREDQALSRTIEQSERVAELREQLGYLSHETASPVAE